ncbi:helix-turn-helix domain-containing protein [Streptomyces sp. 4R-3d]|uniref:helix-turn-helix domain-containing protein n=1 Tax=Streptomyces sp. 4R-3d TaxID=2559605 RepID=UPI001072EC43|nr:helix-turn-helix domain-containing protein [Streptomyces sp. 4R-3d]TFI30102.1 helix-turn-helix domain-containing protein [Streptomyces sp. 4R-3d]
MSRAAIAELLKAGHTAKAIARQLHVHTRTITAVRKTLDLPPTRSGPKPSDPEALFWRRTQPTDDGHLLWPGASRQLRGGDNKLSVYRVAFRIGHGREPVGNVMTGCGRPRCVLPAHVEDRPMRQQYKAIFGEAS